MLSPQAGEGEGIHKAKILLRAVTSPLLNCHNLPHARQDSVRHQTGPQHTPECVLIMCYRRNTLCVLSPVWLRTHPPSIRYILLSRGTLQPHQTTLSQQNLSLFSCPSLTLWASLLERSLPLPSGQFLDLSGKAPSKGWILCSQCPC